MGHCYGKLAPTDRNEGSATPRPRIPPPEARLSSQHHATASPLGSVGSTPTSAASASPRAATPASTRTVDLTPRSAAPASSRSTASVPVHSPISDSPRSLYSESRSPRSTTSAASRSADSSTFSYPSDDIFVASRSPSGRSVAPSTRQDQGQPAGLDGTRHVRGCKCLICQPGLYDGADPRLISRSAVRGAFMEPCVDFCRCARCCQQRNESV